MREHTTRARPRPTRRTSAPVSLLCAALVAASACGPFASGPPAPCPQLARSAPGLPTITGAASWGPGGVSAARDEPSAQAIVFAGDTPARLPAALPAPGATEVFYGGLTASAGALGGGASQDQATGDTLLFEIRGTGRPDGGFDVTGSGVVDGVDLANGARQESLASTLSGTVGPVGGVDGCGE